MNNRKLSDQALHQNLLSLRGTERDIVAKILCHLREVDRRKMFCDFEQSSLFDYAVNILGYSEGQAHRRIQAMRLIKGLPPAAKKTVENKIKSGELSLSNVSSAQSVFNRVQKAEPNKAYTGSQKASILRELENKSARDGQKVLLKLQPTAALPLDRQRVLSEEKTELKIVIDETTKELLENVRALLGPKGADMTYDELFKLMAQETTKNLEAKRFGKKRTQPSAPEQNPLSTLKVDSANENSDSHGSTRYLPAGIRHRVWVRDNGRCTKCAGKRNLQFDHRLPLAFGGETSVENLRLLCFHCNQREAIHWFGEKHLDKMSNLP